MEPKLPKVLSDAKQYLRKNPVSSALFVLGVLYSTVFIEYIGDGYFDYFKDSRVRGLLVVLVAFASYADPRNGVVLLVCLLRTIRYVRKAENFGVSDVVNAVSGEDTESLDDPDMEDSDDESLDDDESIDLDDDDDDESIDLDDDEDFYL